jgi:hypothetical protein
MPKRGSRKQRRAVPTAPSARPSQVVQNAIVRRKILYTGGGSSTAIRLTGYSLCLSMGAVCTVTNNQLVSFFSSVRLRSIKVWSAGDESVSGTPTPATIGVNWTGYTNSPNTLVCDTSTSTAFPAHVASRPPRMSLASYWQSSDSNSTIVQINVGSTHTTIEVELEGILYTSDPAGTLSPATLATSTGTQGITYYPSLDNVLGHLFPPAFLNTAF